MKSAINYDIKVVTHFVEADDGSIDEIRVYQCFMYVGEMKDTIFYQKNIADKSDLDDSDHSARYKILFDDWAVDKDEAEKKFLELFFLRMKRVMDGL